MKKIRRVLFSADLLRITELKRETTFLHSTVLLDGFWELLSYQLSTAINLPVEKFVSGFNNFDVFEFYNLCGIKPNDKQAWFEIYDLKVIPQEALDYFEGCIKDSIVIYFEAPNIFKTIHNKLNIPYINFNYHPVRFLDDMFLGFETNCEHVFNRMKKFQTNETLFYIQAGLHKANFARTGKLKIKPNSVLLAGQMNVDKSVYNNGKFYTIFDFKAKIEELGKKYNTVYYKPHPYNKDLKKVYEFLKQFPFVELIHGNIYEIMSNENIKKLAAITSGSLYEAKYFGKESEYLLEPYLKFDYSKDCKFSSDINLSIYDEFLAPYFWSEILQDIVPVNECEKIALPPRANRFRGAIRRYWGIEEIDSTGSLIEARYPALKNIKGKSEHIKLNILGLKISIRRLVV